METVSKHNTCQASLKALGRIRHEMARTPSQNVRFTGGSTGDCTNEPPGRGLTGQIAVRLREKGFAVSEIDNWRDSGWCFKVMIGEAEMEIAIASLQDRQSWMLQIACVSEPGLVAQLFGKRFTDRSAEVAELAAAVDEVLRSLEMSAIRWRVDGFPTDENSTDGPSVP